MFINFYVWWLKSRATMTTTVPQAALINGSLYLNEEWFDDLEIEEQITAAKHQFYHWCIQSAM